MAKFELEFELTGLKIKLKSEREDAPKALNAVQQQIGNLLQAATGLGASDTPSELPPSAPHQVAPPPSRTLEGERSENHVKGRPVQRRRTTGADTNASVDFSHNPSKHGMPKQSWNTAQKSMWLLHVLEKQGGPKDLTTAALAGTFNKHFKEFGQITTTNVTRDLGRAKAKNHWVSSDVTKDPQTWYLLDAGKTEVEKMIAAGDGKVSK